jgi:hypothetical protein
LTLRLDADVAAWSNTHAAPQLRGSIVNSNQIPTVAAPDKSVLHKEACIRKKDSSDHAISAALTTDLQT